jgi:hypothetical protein
MAKKKGHGRNIYFKDIDLWARLKAVAEEKHWSVNRLIEITMSANYPKE